MLNHFTLYKSKNRKCASMCFPTPRSKHIQLSPKVRIMNSKENRHHGDVQNGICFPPEEDIVISGLLMSTRFFFANSFFSYSGIAGTYPESKNLYELQNNLYNNVDMVTEDNRRWDVRHFDIPSRAGKIPEINKFDAGFFGKIIQIILLNI